LIPVHVLASRFISDRSKVPLGNDRKSRFDNHPEK